jgi:hypothetical protein
VADHRQQLGLQGPQVDLVPQPGREPLDGAGGVVAAAVEAAVHRLLDAAAGRLEQGGNGQGGRGHRPAGGGLADPARQLPADQGQAGVDAPEPDGEQPVDQGAVQQPVVS